MEPDWKKLEQLTCEHFRTTLACVTLVLICFIGGCTAVCLDDSPAKAGIHISSKPTKTEKGVITEAQFEEVKPGMSWSQVLTLLGDPAVEIDGDGQDVWKTADGRLATVYYDNMTDDTDDSPNVTHTELTGE